VLQVFGVQGKRCDADEAQLAQEVSFLKLMIMTDVEEVTLKIKAHFHIFQVPRTLGR